jgi:hypothetical protein
MARLDVRMVTATVWSRRPTRSAPTLEEIEYGVRAAGAANVEAAAPVQAIASRARTAHSVAAGAAIGPLPHRWQIDEQTERRRPRRPTEEPTP